MFSVLNSGDVSADWGIIRKKFGGNTFRLKKKKERKETDILLLNAYLLVSSWP